MSCAGAQTNRLEAGGGLILVVGVGRSGTSLLQSMLASHPGVSSLPETSFFRRYVARGTLSKLFKRNGMAEVRGWLAKDDLVARTDIGLDRLLVDGENNPNRIDEQAYANLIEWHRRNNHIVDKDPRLIEYLSVFSDRYPEAHIVHIVRDPRDVLLSKKKAQWSRSGHTWKHALAYRAQFRLGVEYGKNVGNLYHEVSYEELISDPVRVLTSLCQQIGIAFEDRMLDFATAARSIVSDSELQWKQETLGRLLVGNSGKWESELSVEEIVLIEKACAEGMTHGGYAASIDLAIVGWRNKTWVACGLLLIRVATPAYILLRRLKNRMLSRMT